MKSKILNTLTLFTSFSTLFCCALPALFVTLGLGGALVGMVSTFPQLIWFSQNKGIVFAAAGIMLLLGGLLQWQAQKESCPVDPNLREACEDTRPWSRITYFISVAIYCVGLFFAYIINWF